MVAEIRAFLDIFPVRQYEVTVIHALLDIAVIVDIFFVVVIDAASVGINAGHAFAIPFPPDTKDLRVGLLEFGELIVTLGNFLVQAGRTFSPIVYVIDQADEEGGDRRDKCDAAGDQRRP